MRCQFNDHIELRFLKSNYKKITLKCAMKIVNVNLCSGNYRDVLDNVEKIGNEIH